MSIERATQLVRKWQPAFGLGDFRIHVKEHILDGSEEAWAYSYYHPDEMWGVIEIPGDGVLAPQLQELYICHELAHGLLQLARQRGVAEEQACNRIARLALRDLRAPFGDERRWQALGDDFFNERNSKRNGAEADHRAWLPIVVDALPEKEREVITAHYFNNESLRDIADRMCVSHVTVMRWRDSAQERMRRYFDALDRQEFNAASRRLIALKEPEGGYEHEVVYLLHHRCPQANAILRETGPNSDLDLLVFPVGNVGYAMPKGIPFEVTALDPCGGCGRTLTTWFVWAAGRLDHPGEVWTP